MLHTFIFLAVTGLAGSQSEIDSNTWIDGDETQTADVIQRWKNVAEKTNYLKANVTRTVFNDTFKTVCVSEGFIMIDRELGYRLSIAPVRNIKLESLQSDWEVQTDGREEWSVTPTMVYDIDRSKRMAVAVEVPKKPKPKETKTVSNPHSVVPHWTQNLNDGFLLAFGLPIALTSEEVIDSIVNNCDIELRLHPDKTNVAISFIPNTRDARDIFSRVDIMLDLKTYLPNVVRFTDPAKTKRTVYSLSNVKPNYRKSLHERGFRPGPSYKIHTIGSSRSASKSRTVPNIVGLAHDIAVKKLKDVGVTESQIIKNNAGPAPRKSMKFRVASQVLNRER